MHFAVKQPRRIPVIAGIFTVSMLLITAMSGPAAGAAYEIDDPAIRDAVEEELADDDPVPFNEIAVESRDGVITLRGQVSNLLVKERAARIAKTVKGVRTVVNRIQVRPSIVRSDVDLRTDVENALLNDPATESYEITVGVSDHSVTLTGRVDSWQERRLAAKVAKGVRGVVSLENRIEVREPEERSDAAIKADVRGALQWDALLEAGLIEVDVQRGRVLLSGTVGSAAEKERAVMDAWVTGVVSVDADDLKIRDWARDKQQRRDEFVVKSDGEIRNAVEDALFYDPRLSAFDVTVAVEGGFVTLRGSVDNVKAKRAAERDALNTVGVHGVTNRIRIQTEPPPAPETIGEKVRNALQRDPLVDRYEIIVNVIGQTVYLDGTVDTYFEKAQADDVAARVRGVVRVRNNLQVSQKRDPYLHDPYVEDWTLFDPEWYDYAPGVTFKADAEIREDIRSELFWSPFVDEEQIEVSVDDGVATLRGMVDSRAERSSAEANAFDGGATWVVNRLDVR